MSKLSYQLSVKRYQRELELDVRKFNALDVKHDDINLLKQLQLLNPIIVAPASAPASAPPPANTGFYGTFIISNEPNGEMNPVGLIAKLAYNNVDITDYISIASDDSQTLTIPIEDRLPNPSSLLQLKVIIDEGATSVNSEDFTGFTPVSGTGNPLTEDNTFELLIDENQIDGGELTLILIVAS
jgi:hypothetical protein